MDEKAGEQNVERISETGLGRLLHYNMTCIGGFMGTFAVCGFGGNFASAQTGNIMSLTKDLAGGGLVQAGIRLGALILFSLSIAAAYLIKRMLDPDMERLCLVVDAGGLLLCLLLPGGLPDLVRLYPIFIASSFQWGTFSGTDGYNSSTIFTTNNLKQCVLGWTQYFLDHEEDMRRRAWFYTITVGAFIAGAFTGCMAVLRMGYKGVVCGFGFIVSAGLLSFFKKREMQKRKIQNQKPSSGGASAVKDRKFHASAV